MNIDQLIRDNSGGGGDVAPPPPTGAQPGTPLRQLQWDQIGTPSYAPTTTPAARPGGKGLDVDKLIRDNSTPSGAALEVTAPPSGSGETGTGKSAPPTPDVPPANPLNQGWGGFGQGLQTSMLQGMIPGIQYAGPALTAGLSALTGQEGFSQAYNRLRGEYNTQHQQFVEQHPVASGAGEMLGGLATPGVAALPFAGPTAGPLRAVIQNTGVSAAVGGVTGALNTSGDVADRLQGAGEGAAIGGVLGGATTGLGRLAKGTYQAIAPYVSKNARELAATRELQNQGVMNAPIEQPTIPGVQYNLGQAVNTPGAARASRWAGKQTLSSKEQPTSGVVTAADQASRNNTALGAALERVAPGTSTPSAASSELANALREGEGLLEKHENILWGHGPMATERLHTRGFKLAMTRAFAGLSQPMKAVGVNSQINKLLTAIDKMPDMMTGSQMNTYKSVLGRLARHPPSDNPQVGGVAGSLAEAARNALADTIRTQGSPALGRAYQTANAFTSKKAQMLGQTDTGAVLNTNRTGQFSTKASLAARRLFNLTEGSPENPANLQDIRTELRSLRLNWYMLQRAGHPVDPADLMRVEQQIKTSTQQWLVSKLLDATTTKLDESGNRFLNLNKVASTLQDNAEWIIKSGLFSRPQLVSFGDVLRTIGNLRRTETGGPAGIDDKWGSKLVDAIISPTTQKLARIAGYTAAAGSLYHGHIMESFGDLGGGSMAAHGLEKMHDKLQQLVTKIAQDPEFARQLQTKFSTKLTPGSQAHIRDLLTYTGARAGGSIAGATH